MNDPIWKPSAERIADSNMMRFLSYVRAHYAPELPDYPTLYDWSIESPEAFWPAVWSFCGVQASREWDSVLIDGDKMLGARWFSGSRLNFAQNMLRQPDEHLALVFWAESGREATVTYGELRERVARLAHALRDMGVGIGDRVAGVMPNTPETVIAMLASTSIGASWSCCSPDFGPAGILDRFVQIGPKVLFTTDGYIYNGKAIALRHMSDVVSQLPGLRKLVVVPYLQDRAEISTIATGVRYADFVGQGATPRPKFEQLPFDHPTYILYSSGTTGKPKCIVHGAGGTLLQHLKELVLHTDVKPGERVFYYTTTGWMMWNWLVSSLAVGATVVLYDGSPFHPHPHSLFDLVEEEGVNVFGTSAKYLSALKKTGLQPNRTHDLKRLKTVLSTGSPLAPESFDYVYRHISAEVQLSSISGGTDIVSCFALGNPLLPVHRGELQCRGLGMKVEVYTEQGKSVSAQKGELVCTRPFPSMPICFWNDPDGEKYRMAYFDKYPNVWAHGDYAELTPRGGLVVYGRSDAVLNPGGVRIGTAEIYRQVEALAEVLESLAIGQEWHDDTRVVLFVRLREGIHLNDALRDKIKATIRANTSPRHVPAKIIEVAELPRTISGKLVELAVREVVHNRPVKNVDALANPEALELFKDLPELNSD